MNRWANLGKWVKPKTRKDHESGMKGRRFGTWTTVRYLDSKKGYARWILSCSKCEKESIARIGRVTGSKKQRCPCKAKNKKKIIEVFGVEMTIAEAAKRCCVSKLSRLSEADTSTTASHSAQLQQPVRRRAGRSLNLGKHVGRPPPGEIARDDFRRHAKADALQFLRGDRHRDRL